jgi:hypothetical protein
VRLPAYLRVAQCGQGVLVGQPQGVKDLTHLRPLQIGQELLCFGGGFRRPTDLDAFGSPVAVAIALSFVYEVHA